MIIIQKEQFASYIKQYERLIITICLSFTKNYFDAEDLAQQTFLSAYQNYENLMVIILRLGLQQLPQINVRIFLKVLQEQLLVYLMKIMNV